MLGKILLANHKRKQRDNQCQVLESVMKIAVNGCSEIFRKKINWMVKLINNH